MSQPVRSFPIQLAVLLSGSGTTLKNLLDCIADGRLRAEVRLVLSNRPDALGLWRAEKAGVPIGVIQRRDFPTRQEFSRAIFDRCRQADVGLVCLAGFLQLVDIPEDFLGRVMNIHPSLIPAFCGKGFYGHHVHEGVLAQGAKVTGCTVHFADNEYDQGPIVIQRAVPVLEDDTPDTLAARVFEQECQAYPEAIRLFAEGRLRIDGPRVRVLPPMPALHCTADGASPSPGEENAGPR